MELHGVPDIANPSKVNPSRAESRAKLPTVPTSSFNVYPINKDGDCFFNAMATALKGSGVDATAGDLREALANYLGDKDNKGALSRHEAVVQAGGIAAVKQRIETPGHWNSDAGDLVVSIAAQALGREIRVLQPNDENGQQYREIAAIPAHTDALPGEDKGSLSGEVRPPIYLLQSNNSHYDYLDPKVTQQSPTNSSSDSSPASSSNGNASLNQAAQTASTSNVGLNIATEDYASFIGRELLAGKSPEEASPQQLQKGLAQLERIFDRYEDAVIRVDSGKRKGISTKSNKTVAEARNTKHEIEDIFSKNKNNRFGIMQRKGRQEALKAMNLVGGRIALELRKRKQQGAEVSSALNQKPTDLLERLPKKLQQPSFKHDAKRLEKDLRVLTATTTFTTAVAPANPPAAGPVADDHPIIAATKMYKPFISTELLKGTDLQTASPEQLRDGIKAFAELVDLYCTATRKMDLEDSKRSQVKSKALQKNLKHTKHSIEDSLGDNTSRRNGIEYRGGRQGALKAMSLIHSRLNFELEEGQGNIGNNPAIAKESRELMAALSKKLADPGFRHSANKLKSDIREQSTRKEVGVEKVAIMQGYVDNVSGTLNMLSSVSNAEDAAPKAWQSKTVDKIVGQVQSELGELKKSLKPTLNNAELVEVGIQTNQILEKGYTKIAKHAQSQITQMSQGHHNKSTVSSLKVLRDTSLLAAQHHRSSHQVGTVVKAEHEFELSLPHHTRERIGTVAAPGIDRSATTTVMAGVSAGFDLARIGVSKVIPGENEDTVVPLNTIGATVGGSIIYQNTPSASIARANDGNLFLENTSTNTLRVSAEASVGLATKAVKKALGDLSIRAKVDGSVNLSEQRGSVTLASSPAVGFGSHHAPKLANGNTAGNGVGRFANLTGVDDAFGTRKLTKVSEASIKLGYNNDHEVAAGLHSLLGDGVVTAYDRSGKGPLAEMFTSASLEGRPVTEGQPPIGVMSVLFPDPIWESTDYKSTSWKANISAKAIAEADALGSAASFLSTSALGVGAKAGLSGSISFRDTNRTVRSAKLPHDIFDPGLTLSPRRSVEYAQDYFSNPSAANLILSKPVARAMGFENTVDYFSAVADSFGDDGPQIEKVDSEQLTQRYMTFQGDVNLIDQFFLQPESTLRESKLPELQKAIQRINENYGARLPDIKESNMGEFTTTNKKGKTESYQHFQDTAVAIVSSFSAVGGAMKLMASQSNPNPEQKAILEEASASLLFAIENRSMPWNKKEMANRGTYVRQAVTEPFSHSVTTSLTGEALAFQSRKGGNYDVSGILESGAEAVAGSSSTGYGAKVTKIKTTSTLADNVSEPGQTGVTRSSVTTRQQRTGPYRDFRQADSLWGKVKQTLLEAVTLKKEVSYTQNTTKTRTYTARASDNPNTAREFTAYVSTSTREKRGVSASLGGAVPAGPASVTLEVGRAQDKNDYELQSFTYGNDVGAMAIISDKIFSDYKINMKDVAAQISSSQQAEGLEFTFFENLDDRFSYAILGNEQYDHMSSIISKFRNSGFVEATNNGEKSLQYPTVTENGMASPVSLADLHNSKGQALDLAADKKYVDRSGLLGYVVARYDEDLIQDAFKHWGAHDVSFPDITEIDGLLSKKVTSGDQHRHEGESIEQTRQQWLKSATKEERKDFYQNDTDGQQMVLNYLKVISFSASVNGVIFQNNTMQMTHDQVDRVDRLFSAPTELVSTYTDESEGGIDDTTSRNSTNASSSEVAYQGSAANSEGSEKTKPVNTSEGKVSPAVAKIAENFGGLVGQETTKEEPALVDISKAVISPAVAKIAENFGGAVDSTK